tara:strand:- start:491 stop:667 length:177 start_codon:yes stop_codon:yes gene_type:complete
MEIKFTDSEVCKILEDHVWAMLGADDAESSIKAKGESYVGLNATVTVEPVDSKGEDEK